MAIATSTTTVGTGGFWPSHNPTSVGTCGWFLAEAGTLPMYEWRLRPSEDVRGLRQAIGRQDTINVSATEVLQDILDRLAGAGI